VEEQTFVEQAEYIPKDEFLDLSSDHPNENAILKKLTQSGAKLITGPRGSGKTTLILKAYYQLLENDSTIPVYVNYKTSLKLEPNYKNNTNGTYWFTYWMYLKIYIGILKVIEEINVDFQQNIIKKETLNSLLEKLELGDIDSLKLSGIELDVSVIQSLISEIITTSGRKRCVIFFDDAAHAFSAEQQRDFFELFRKIKNKEISPKAAIYPGVTNFSPTFNLGHDAEQINVWINPENENYISFMTSLVKKRIPEKVYEEFIKDENLLQILCLSAFGIPRQFLNMVRNLYGVDDQENITISFNRKTVINEIRSSYKSTMSVFTSLETKMPTYKNFVNEGISVYDKVIELIYEYNKSKNTKRKSIIIAIRKPINGDLKKIFGFYQYAGLVAFKDQVSKGEKGVFDRYLINIASLVDKNAILTTQSFNSSSLAEALLSRNAHEYTRTTSEKLLSENVQSISLTLPPCQNCGAERINENAKFCHNCGNQLKQASVFKQLADEDIKKLNLTPRRVNAIKKHSSIKKIKDIIYDIGHRELRSVPQIGEYWAKNILQLAEEYIS
jgi:ABC-type lipoprotein export system ATPase subunit